MMYLKFLGVFCLLGGGAFVSGARFSENVELSGIPNRPPIWELNMNSNYSDRLIQGDILLPAGLTRADLLEAQASGKDEILGHVPKLSAGGICLNCKFWPYVPERNRYEVPYVFYDRFNDAHYETIMAAMRAIEANTHVAFVERVNEPDYIFIFARGGCWSLLGRFGGPQELSLNKAGCVGQGTVIHELFHALGLGHEHQRPDRDSILEIVYENIEPAKVDQLILQSFLDGGEDSPHYTPFDLASIMHYDTTSFGKKKGEDTLTTIKIRNDVGGKLAKEIVDRRKIAPSTCDWQEINILYPGPMTTAKCTPGVVEEVCAPSDECVGMIEALRRRLYPEGGVTFEHTAQAACELYCYDDCDFGFTDGYCKVVKGRKESYLTVANTTWSPSDRRIRKRSFQDDVDREVRAENPFVDATFAVAPATFAHLLLLLSVGIAFIAA